MSAAASPAIISSSSAEARLTEAIAWLERRPAGQEVLVVAPTLEAGGSLASGRASSLGQGAAQADGSL